MATHNPAASAAPAPAPDTPVPVPPFTTGFDFEENWCAGNPSDVGWDLAAEIVDDHPDIAALIHRAFDHLDDPDEGHEILTGWVRDLDELVNAGHFEPVREDVDVEHSPGYADLTPDEQWSLTQDAETDADEAYDRALCLEEQVADLRDQLESAAAQMTWCTSYCSCASDAYQSWARDDLNDALAELGAQTWAVLEQRWNGAEDAEPDVGGTLDVDTLAKRAGCYIDGWSSLTLTWDGNRLQVEFGAGRGGRTDLVLVPLTEEQDKAREIWQDSDAYADNIAGRVVLTLTDPAALNAALSLWAAADDPDSTYGDFGDLVAGILEVGVENLDGLNVPVLVKIAPTWTAGVPALLNATLDLMGRAPVTAFAA